MVRRPRRIVRGMREDVRGAIGGNPMIDDRIRPLVEKIWRYHQLNHELSRADAILVLCSHDTRVAERGARLFLDGWAPWLIFSGGLGSITRRLWREPEADQFARIAAAMGVPEDRILIENQSTNTGENILFTRRLVEARTLALDKFIVVQKPYMERRSYATFRQVWPDKDVLVTSPLASLDEYLSAYSHEALSPGDVISIMVGDLQRIREYPARGFQIAQEIPEDVWNAYLELVEAGYDRHLIGGLRKAMDKTATAGRPGADEAAEYYFTYIDRVGEGDICRILRDQGTEIVARWRAISEDRSRYRCAPGKWSVRQLVNHVNDTERLFVFRALWFARGFDSPLPSFDQNVCATASGADERSWGGLVEEFAAVRAATVAFFESLPADAWLRRGVASDNPFSVRALAYLAAGHVMHHAGILAERYVQG